jgi:hypothetical protein
VTGVLNKALEDAGLNITDILTDLGIVKDTATNEFGKYSKGTPTITSTNTPIYTHPTLAESRQKNTLDAALKIWGITPKMHTGASYVPATRPYMLERGETVLSKNASTNGGNQTISININNPQISNDYDLSKVARTLENVVRANLINNKYGKSKYRMA